MAEKDSGAGRPQGGDAFRLLSDGLADAVARAGQATVRVEARRRIGATGVVWAPDGLVVTADHAIEREEDIVVGLADGREEKASLVGRDPRSDLALLRVGGAPLTAIVLCPAAAVRVGHIVLALGRPGEGVSATIGIASAIGGPWRSRHGGQLESFIRTDVIMYPGYSGGPLVDTAGRMIGLNSSLFSRGMSICVPAATVAKVVDTLRQHGRVRQAYLGLRTQPVALQQPIAERLGQDAGLLVVGLEPGGPAERGGMLLGDILLAIAGSAVRDPEDLQAELRPDRVGQSVAVAISRGGVRQELGIVVGER